MHRPPNRTAIVTAIATAASEVEVLESGRERLSAVQKKKIAKVLKIATSRVIQRNLELKMLQNEPVVGKVGLGTAEYGPSND